MWALLVVVSAPVGDDSSCFEEVFKPADAQAFLAQSAVKALGIVILRELAGLFVMVALDIPRNEVTAG